MKKRGKLHYAALNKDTNSLLVATSKTAIASFIHVHEATIRRWLDISSPYITEHYIVWRIYIKTIQRNRFQKPTLSHMPFPPIYERKKRAIKLSSILSQSILRKPQHLAQSLLLSSSSLQQ